MLYFKLMKAKYITLTIIAHLLNTISNEQSTTISNRRIIKDIFPGVPEDISSAFRYLNQNIFFLRRSILYKYIDFTKA